MSLIDTICNFFRVRGQEKKEGHTKRRAALRSMADLDALLDATFATPATPLVHRVARPCFHILPHGEAGQAPVGCSRLGGAPDLPLGASWPTAADGQLLTFYGQINTEEISKTLAPSMLPAQGLLSIFCGSIDSFSESIEACVLVTAPDATLQRLAPPASSSYADGSMRTLDPVRIRFEAGLSFPTQNSSFVNALETAAPDCDLDGLVEAMEAAPESAFGQLLGYAQFSLEDVHSKIYFSDIGRANQDRLLIWDNWEDWETAKKMNSRLANGQVYRPWSAADDENVRWMFANRAAIASGTEQWHALLWIASNPLMDMWINDADPIYFLTKVDHEGRLMLSDVRAGATQS